MGEGLGPAHNRWRQAPSSLGGEAGGYLGSDMPSRATPAGQAGAFAALLDALGIAQIDVAGISAGATSVLQLALRHPEQVKHLVVLSGNLPGGRTAAAPPPWAQAVVPAGSHVADQDVVPVQHGVRVRSSETIADEQRRRSVRGRVHRQPFPAHPKVRGVDFDAFVSNADVNNYQLEAITVPTLIAHAKDGPLASCEAAERAARRIPGARFVSLETGGHLLLGQTGAIQRELATFLSPSVVA